MLEVTREEANSFPSSPFYRKDEFQEFINIVMDLFVSAIMVC